MAQGLFGIRVRWNSTQSRSKWLLKKAPPPKNFARDLSLASARMPGNIKSPSTGPLRRKHGSKVVELCFQFALHGWPYEIKNWMWLWYQPQTHVRDALMFSESQSVYHVNVIGDWKLVELGCALLSVKCLLGAVMCLCVRVCACLCVPAQLHTFTVTAMCILCRLVCVWLHILELHIRYQITFVSRDLAFLRGCQPAVTACMSRESSMCSIIPNLTLEPDGSYHWAFGFGFVRIQTR